MSECNSSSGSMGHSAPTQPATAMRAVSWKKKILIQNKNINPNSVDNKGSCWILKDFYCSVTMLIGSLGVKQSFGFITNHFVHKETILVNCYFSYGHRVYGHRVYGHRVYRHRVYGHQVYGHRVYRHWAHFYSIAMNRICKIFWCKVIFAKHYKPDYQPKYTHMVLYEDLTWDQQSQLSKLLW